MPSACTKGDPVLIKSAVSGSTLSLPPLTDVGDGLVCALVAKADLFLELYDSKQSRDSRSSVSQ